MYCTKCGKFIDGPEQLCDECSHNESVLGDGQKQQDAVQPPNAAQQQPQQPAAKSGGNPRMLAFKPSLAAVITGAIGYVFMLVAFILAVQYVWGGLGHLTPSFDFELGEYVYPTVTDLTAIKAVAWVFFVLALPLTVVGLVFGIRSLLTVVRAKKQGAPMAIAPLILSISAIVLAGLSAIFGLMFLITFATL
ncbi:MAG: hypothetical protein K2M89_01665 [Clostridiales bacterium]|nr:hypothetical protein [Clostridiales bacterium]